MTSENNSHLSEKLTTTHKFARNAVFNVAGFVSNTLVLILLTPYALKLLGKTQFGIWAIGGAFISYVAISKLGMNTAIIKFVAEHWAKQEVDRVSTIVSTVFFSFCVLGGIVVIGALLFSRFIVVNIFKVPPNMQPDALFFIDAALIIWYLSFPFSVYNSALEGLQRMDVVNIIMVISRILHFLGLWVFLGAGLGLKGIVWNRTIIGVLIIGANIFFVKRLAKGVKINLHRFSFSELRKIMKYSVNIFISSLMSLGYHPTNKIILGAYTSLPFVSFYAIGAMVTDTIGGIFRKGIAPLLPAASELQGKNKTKEIGQLYISISRMLYLFIVPLFLMGIAFAEPVVKIWLGAGNKVIALTIQVLFLGNMVSLLIVPQYCILQGIGKPHLSALVNAVGSFVNIVAAFILVWLIGYQGVLLATLLSVILATILTVYLFHRVTEYSFFEYVQSLPLGLLTIGAVLGGNLWIISKKFTNWNIFLVASAFSLFYIVALMSLLKEEDKRVFKKLKSAILSLTKQR